MRGRRSRILLLAGVLLALAVCMQLGVGAARPTAAPVTGAALSAEASTQPATGPAGASKLGRPDSGSGGDWGKFARNAGKLGNSDTGGTLWQMLGMLVVIGVLGLAGLWFVRRVMPKISTGRGRNISVLETACLGPHKSVHLLRVGGKEFLVASTRERISMLADVTGASSAPAEENEHRETQP